jgi:hypothetical protein
MIGGGWVPINMGKSEELPVKNRGVARILT